MATEINYTCNTCGLSFGAGEYQREHMKTDWHRYNLKRRVAELPPIPADVFAQKMLQIQEQQNAPAPSKKQVTKKDMKRQEKEAKRQENLTNKLAGVDLADRANSLSSISSIGFSAGEPSREFLSSSEQMSSSEYSTDVSESEPEDDSASVRSGVSNGDDVDRLLKQKLKTYVHLPPSVSFMDGHESASALDNARYLGTKYGLVIPEESHVSDWDGLMSYFNEKVSLGNCCLSCTYMGRSLAAARAHMLDKQHVKVPWDTDEERAEIIDFYDYGDDDEDSDEGWEDVEGETQDAGSDADVEDTDTESHSSEYYHPDQAYVDGYELILGSSGRAAGHRSLNRYFKQRAMQPLEKPGRRAVKLIDYRSPGVTERAADKMVKSSWSEQKKAQQKFNRGRRQQNFQAHFRDQMLQ